MFGLLIKFFDSLRSKDWAAAFFDTLPWILIVVSLVILLLSTQMAVDMQLVEQPDVFFFHRTVPDMADHPFSPDYNIVFSPG
ncbi:MAG: hypothetical protein U5N58_02970 [Actinomycetota bacterium]|nr:hypothetical protein [Actinomycetota bacterium]